MLSVGQLWRARQPYVFLEVWELLWEARLFISLAILPFGGFHIPYALFSSSSVFCYLREILSALLVTSVLCPTEGRHRQLFSFSLSYRGTLVAKKNKALGQRHLTMWSEIVLAHVGSIGLFFSFFFSSWHCPLAKGGVLGSHKWKLN